MNRLIALITDFGTQDHFAGVVKGVIKTINPAAEIVDVTHGVRPFSIVNAQFALHAARRWFPAGTVFMTVVDPGVGTARRGLIARGESHWYVLPDNGILSAVASSDLEVYAIRRDLFEDASSTFHGRDIFAPVAANLALGHNPALFGDTVDDYARRPFPHYEARDEAIDGSVVQVDRFGNVTLSIPSAAIEGFDRGACALLLRDDTHPVNVVRTYAEIPDGGIGMLAGSDGLVELALREKSLAELLDLSIDDGIRVING